MKIISDLDGVLCKKTTNDNNTPDGYSTAEPMIEAIKSLRKLSDQGHDVKIFTTRHKLTDTDATRKWLRDHGIKCKFRMEKPQAQYYIDDCSFRSVEMLKHYLDAKENVIVKKRSVLLFSGGVDSLIGHYFLKHEKIDHENLYFSMGCRCCDEEKAAIYELQDEQEIKIFVHEDNVANFGIFEEKDGIVPMKNMCLLMECVKRGVTDIYIPCHQGERHIVERSLGFFKDAEIMLTTMMGFNVHIHLLFKNMTKQDMVGWFKGAYPELRDIFKFSRSCDVPNKKSFIECGNCLSCLEKWIALEHNKIFTSDFLWEDIFRVHPGSTDLAKKLFDKMRFSGIYEKRNREQSMEVLRPFRNLKPQKRGNTT